jgi:Sulfite exporter TauE/SafE
MQTSGATATSKRRIECRTSSAQIGRPDDLGNRPAWFHRRVADLTVTAPVGVSGAVFLLPVQLSIRHVPSPEVTPTNLLFNVVAGPGALLRYRNRGGLAGPLTRLLLIGTVPGVILGAIIRVFVVEPR